MVKISHPVLAFNLNQTYRENLRPVELYDITRHAWKLSERRLKAHYAFAVYKGIVQEVFTIAAWFPQNTTLNTKVLEDINVSTDRWEFVGNIAPEEIRKAYIYKDISDYTTSSRNPLTYINC
jgi:hypothetical protein